MKQILGFALVVVVLLALAYFKSLRDKGQRTGRNSCPLLLYSLSYCKSTPKISTWSKKGGPHNEHLELVITLSDYF